MNRPLPSASEEGAHLLGLHHGNAAEAMKVLSAQFAVIQSRTQLLLTLATLTLTITGFSGPRIAHSGAFARYALSGGLGLVLVGVVALLWGSLRIRWLTQYIDADPAQALTAMIAQRNHRTAWFGVQLVLLVSGLAAYVAAVIAYLLQGDASGSLPG
ncbi:MAG: hypothetical protein H0V44_10320 [Planctomycetes bacterium]|nr:hypothetical protein [Planctomycetota bacterium]